LKSLSIGQLENLSALGTYYSAKQGTRIIKQGELQDKIYFVLSGELKVYYGDNDKMHLLATIRKSEPFGEANLVVPVEAIASIITSQPTELWCMDKKKLSTFLRAYPDIGLSVSLEVNSLLSHRIHKNNRKVATLLDSI